MPRNGNGNISFLISGSFASRDLIKASKYLTLVIIVPGEQICLYQLTRSTRNKHLATFTSDIPEFCICSVQYRLCFANVSFEYFIKQAEFAQQEHARKIRYILNV